MLQIAKSYLYLLDAEKVALFAASGLQFSLAAQISIGNYLGKGLDASAQRTKHKQVQNHALAKLSCLIPIGITTGILLYGTHPSLGRIWSGTYFLGTLLSTCANPDTNQKAIHRLLTANVIAGLCATNIFLSGQIASLTAGPLQTWAALRFAPDIAKKVVSFAETVAFFGTLGGLMTLAYHGYLQKRRA